VSFEQGYDYLYRFFDGKDPFMAGHQPVKDKARPGGIARYIPEWSKDDAFIRELLLRAFPNWSTDPKQRERMGQWARTIYLYYRLRIPASSIAEQMGFVGTPAIKNRLRMIRNVAKGLNTAGKVRHVQGTPQASTLARTQRRRTKAKVLDGYEEKLTEKGIQHDPNGEPLSFNGVVTVFKWNRVRHDRKNPDRVVPEWTKDRQAVIDILKTAFPRFWNTRESLKQARRWFGIIHYYYRKKATRRETARLMGLTDIQVRSALEKISRVQAGKNTAGKTRTQSGPGNISWERRMRSDMQAFSERVLGPASLDTPDWYPGNLLRAQVDSLPLVESGHTKYNTDTI
jgi:hypothetical protein